MPAGAHDTDEAKGRTTSMPETSYRLPEWLGGHAVRVVQHDLAGFSQPHVLVAIQGGDYDGLPLALPSEQLVEVKPPSIDDPVDLPLRIAASSGDRPEREVWLKRRGDETVLDITGDGILIHGRATLDPEGLRLLARAAWQRAAALEAAS